VSAALKEAMTMERFNSEGATPVATSEITKSAAPSTSAPRPRRRRGFAAMDPELQRTIAKKGGKASHALGRAHRWTSEEARLAGLKGALACRERRTEKTEAPVPETTAATPR
jgi:general stress protein YciG